MRPGRMTSQPRGPDYLALDDMFGRKDVEPRKVSVAGPEAAAMFNFDQISVAAAPARDPDDARRRGHHRRTEASGEIDTGMVPLNSGDRVASPAESRGDGKPVEPNGRRADWMFLHPQRRCFGSGVPVDHPVAELLARPGRKRPRGRYGGGKLRILGSGRHEGKQGSD